MKEVINLDNKHMFWPVAAVLLGVLVLMINLGYLPRATLSYWPVLLVIWGLMKIADAGERKTATKKRRK